MKFTELTQYFERLEETSSRLALIDILAELFKKTDATTVDKVMYLTQGRVAPFYEPTEIGMADKMVAQSIGEAFGLTKDEVLAEYARKGDLGIVAFALSEQKRQKGKKDELSVVEVFETLKAIAHTSGVGSVEKKITALKELMEHMDAVSAKHLSRIPLGKTRLGIGDPTILDGIAIAVLGDKSKRKLLEKAYNETSDLGLIGKTLMEGGLEAVQKLGVTVGRPIRSELCERLPNPVKVFEKMAPPRHSGEVQNQSKSGEAQTDPGQARMTDNDGIHATYKYDGFRVQIHKNGDKVEMFSRNLEDMTHMFPELIEGTLKQIKATSVILDSEAMAYQPESEEFLPFQETTKRRRKHNIEAMAESLPLKAFVFDILYVDGRSLLGTPLNERVEIMKKTIVGDEILIPEPGIIMKKPEDLQLMLDSAFTQGLEGVVVKRPDSGYEAGGRNFNWVKLKKHSAGDLSDTIDCVILGYIYGKGKRTAFGAGALLVGLYDKKEDQFVSVTRIGTGLTDDEWRSIKEKTKGLELDHKPARVHSLITPSVWVKPEIVIEVLADEITRSPLHTAGATISDDGVKEPGYALRFPRLITFRDKDKKAEDATSVDELIAMFGGQGKKE
ncbi:MAG: ATP-dependent DNA ligase [Candidatus Levybacteria bacterium]|nr:ATP-dependent DNA ligase [Candidatus Levybacteria bacterium]